MKVWGWAFGKRLSSDLLLRGLTWSRSSSTERFITAFIRENTNEVLSLYNFQPYQSWIRKNKRCLRDLPKDIGGITKEVIEFPIISGAKNKHLVIFIRRRLPLNRIYLSNLPMIKNGDKLTEIQSLPLLFDLVQNIGNKESGKWKKLKRDFLLSNSLLWLSFLLRDIANRDNLFIKKCRKIYNSQTFPADELATFLEEWSINGHHLHPTPKSKFGLSLEDLESYSPESHPEYSIISCLLRRGISHFASSVNQDYEELLDYLSPSFHKKIAHAIKKRGLDPEDFYYIPIHPWNYKNYLRGTIAENLSSKDFVLLPELKLAANPLVAFRTVYVKDLNIYLKLPLNVQITSVVRTLSIKPCYNGIVLSSVLSRLKELNLLPNTFEVQREIASIRIKKEYVFYKNLSVVIREKCEKYVDKNDLLIPAVTFFEDSPIYPTKKI